MARPMLIVAGPYEFLADDPWRYGPYAPSEPQSLMPSPQEGRIALEAYTLLRVDAGWLSPKAARWLKTSGKSIPHGFSEVGITPLARILNTPVGKVGVVFFPEGPIEGKSPTPEQEQKALEAGRALRKDCVLVLGVSPWGYVGERDFLPKAGGVFNVILGGGEGVGFGHSLSNTAPDVLWLRPDSRGRAVNALEILVPPVPGRPFAWRENETFSARLEWLDNRFPQDPAMLKIVGNPTGSLYK